MAETSKEQAFKSLRSFHLLEHLRWRNPQLPFGKGFFFFLKNDGGCQTDGLHGSTTSCLRDVCQINHVTFCRRRKDESYAM